MPQFLDTTEREGLAEFLRNGRRVVRHRRQAGVYSLWIASLRNPAIRGEALEPSAQLCELLAHNLGNNAITNISPQ